jgi:hypothetical protein
MTEGGITEKSESRDQTRDYIMMILPIKNHHGLISPAPRRNRLLVSSRNRLRGTCETRHDDVNRELMLLC